MPEDSDTDLLLNRDFLNYCVGSFGVPYTDSESLRGFQHKFFNIIDPLKEFNNLGRSVSKGTSRCVSALNESMIFLIYTVKICTFALCTGNYYRIRSAFSYGAKKLAQILVQPQHSIAIELRKFFANTMERHGGGPRPDVRDIYQTLVINRPIQDNFDDQAVGESDDLTTSRLDALKISTDSSKSQASSPIFAPHLFFSKSKRHDWNGSLDSDKLDRNASENQLVDKDEAVTSSKTRDVFRDTPETQNSTDLTGDFSSYLDYLHYGRSCYEYVLGVHSLPMAPFMHPSYQSYWDNLLPQLHYKQNGFSHQHPNGFHPNPAVYAMPPILLPGIPYWDDVPKPRGTGTYFPTMVCHLC